MNDLPRREPTPLYAETGRFERTLRKARRRRARAAGLTMVAVLAVCTGGAVALVTSQSHEGTTTADVPATAGNWHDPDNPNNPSAVPSGSRPPGSKGGSQAPGTPGSKSGGPGTNPSRSGSDTPSGGNSDRTGSGSAPGGGSGSNSSGHAGMYHGVVVDHRGDPLPDVGVYVVPQGSAPERITTTDDEGKFEAPCDEPVLLAAKDFGPAAQDPGTAQDGYAYVGGSDQPATPDCQSPAAMAMTTKLPAAGSLQLTVTDSDGSPIAGATEPDLYCDAVTTEPCYEPQTGSDGVYTFTGLPDGQYTLRSGDASKTVSVSAGQTTDVTWTMPPPSSPTEPTEPSSPSSAPDSDASDSNSPAVNSTDRATPMVQESPSESPTP